jgi:hypothetical protein
VERDAVEAGSHHVGRRLMYLDPVVSAWALARSASGRMLAAS